MVNHREFYLIKQILNKMTIGTGITLVGLVNAMIGIVMPMIPILAQDAGYVDWMIACILLAAVTCYTGYLMVKHLGKSKNIKHLILNHFKGDHTYAYIYNMIIWISFAAANVAYFRLFCIQVQGLLNTSQYIPQILAVFLVVWVIALREYDLAEIALASGITSIIGFTIFLFWLDQTASSGPKSLQPHSPNSPVFILTLIVSYAIHDFMIQIIISNPDRKSYPKIVALLFIISNFIIMFMSYSASGLINRVSGVPNPETLMDFFKNNKQQAWVIFVLEILYVVHILSTFPEFLIVSKIRIFQICEIEHNPEEDITKEEVLYIVFLIGLAYSIFKANISLKVIFDAGSIICYIFSMVIPILIHMKCIHYDCSSGYIAGDNERNLCILANQCECDITYRSKTTLWIETAVLLFALIFEGIYIFSSIGKVFSS